MARKTFTSVTIWQNQLSEIEDANTRYVGIYLRTNGHTNMIGAYYLPFDYIKTDTLLDLKTIEKAIELLRESDFAYYDQKTKQVYIPSFAKENVGEELRPGDTRVKNVQGLYNDLKPSFICDLFWNDYGVVYNLQKRSHPNLQIVTPHECVSPIPPPPPPPPRQQEDTGNEIIELLERYTPEEQTAIQHVFELLKLTRKNGKIANSIILTELRRWNTLGVRSVMYGINTYIDRGYHTEDKKEAYLWAIMRRVTAAQLERLSGNVPTNGPVPLVSPLTQHNMRVMDEYWRLRRNEEKLDT